ncbi:MAG: hypothetical protein IPL95_16540 [Saprospiraceae bacterium]|nr:hypothetical protein [Saprospiraceae bacterium]
MLIYQKQLLFIYKIIKNEKGEESYEILSHQKDEFIKSWLRKNPDQTINDIKITEGINNEPIKTIFFENDFNVISGFNNFRAIVKIALNFYFFKRKKHSHIDRAIDFMIGKIDDIGIVQYFYPDNENLLIKNEISHILYLKGDHNQKVLYCYIELYNLHCFIVILLI